MSIDKKKQELIDLYLKQSKHSQYQILPRDFEGILDPKDLNIISRYEYERWNYIKSKVDIKDKEVIDIGGNSGFFSFEAAREGAKKVDYYEANNAHARFVEKAAVLLNRDRQIKVNNCVFDFKEERRKQDIALLLNVLHHIGDDYGDSCLSIEQAKELMMQQLNFMSKIADVVVFQLGFNWKGNPKNCLFKNGTKREMIDLVVNSTKNHFDMLHIGIAEKKNNHVEYYELNDENVIRDDSLGEFLNRPIFILKSK